MDKIGPPKRAWLTRVTLFLVAVTATAAWSAESLRALIYSAIVD